MPFLEISQWLDEPNKIILTDINGVEYTVQDILDFISAAIEATDEYYLGESGEVLSKPQKETS